MHRKNLGFWFLLLSCLLATAPLPAATDQLSLDGSWHIARDPDNSGRDKNWNCEVAADAVACKVPWILQGTFPDYNGLVWYWRQFEVPATFQQGGRYLLHFDQVDYYGEFWLNGTLLGKHEGGETPFVFDVTEALNRNGNNFLAVRVLNPINEPIDGIVFDQTPRRCKKMPFVYAGGSINHGGITGSVRLEAVPAVYLDDVYVDARIDGTVKVRITVNNASATVTQNQLELCISDGRSGDTVISVTNSCPCEQGLSTIEMTAKVNNPRLWELNSPALYRATVRLVTPDNNTFSEKSARFGFRDFRFENGYFRLNGKRIYIKSTHTVNNYPIGLQFPHDPDLWRRDLLNLKTMGFNMVRFIWGGSYPEQLDYCDEIGLMVYNEPYTSHDMQDSPNASVRWHSGLGDLIKRDRNHPSIVIWGLLNEIQAHSVIFRFAVDSLPFVRQLDSSRMVLLNSGRWDTWSGGGMDKRIQRWSGQEQDPFVGKNPTSDQIGTLGITWPANSVALHPGKNNEYSVVRWTAPDSGTLDLTASFEGYAERATTDVHVFLQGRPIFDSFINLNGQENSVSFEKKGLTVTKGDTLDFIVGSGNRNYGGDTTGLAATLLLNGKKWSVADDFSSVPLEGAAWTYGVLPGSETPDVTKWAQYDLNRSGSGKAAPGTLSNPDSLVWEDLVQDQHPYQRVPHTADIVNFLRTNQGYLTNSDQPLFLTEYGIGSAVDLIRTVRFFEQYKSEHLFDAKYYQKQLDKYMLDWDKWRLEEAFDRPEDFFAQSISKMAGQRSIGLNAIRSNPNIVGHSLTGGIDHVLTGEGLTTPFREMKPGTIDAVFDAWAPLRWSVFAEPIHLYRGKNLHLEAVISNEDMLAPGDYPARAEIFDERGKKVFAKPFTVTIDAPGVKEPPFAKLCFSDDIAFDFAGGTYRYVVTLEKGGAPAGGEVKFFVTDQKDMPVVQNPVLIWNEDKDFLDWCNANGIQASPAAADKLSKDSLILVTKGAERADCDPALLDTAVRNGATVVFLCHEYFQNEAANKLFMTDKGTFGGIYSWLYQKDEWSKLHPFFDGMPAGGLMDNQYYREIIPDTCLKDTVAPGQAIAGAIKASQDYESGLMLATYEHGKGNVIISTFLIRESLGVSPAGERLLKNIIINAR
ncbi:MAG: glycoside hydrolase family 2 TIM barrel-domain containing protein [Planctomycetia bacterium]|nr:glycoside hydrolase family 2 TIM barrel-domain containing protein [Planctomycetia bacterium]